MVAVLRKENTMEKIRNLALQAAAMLPTLQLAPTERNCIQLANVYGILHEIDRLARVSLEAAPVDGEKEAASDG